MNYSAALGLIDARPDLPRRQTWPTIPRLRQLSAIDSLTIHYNGPEVAGAGNPAIERRQLVSDAKWQMRPGWSGLPNGAEGLQYHIAVLSDGTALLCRSFEEWLWHAGDSHANPHSLSLHLPVGGRQRPTQPQWARTLEIATKAGALFGFDRTRVLGHREWPEAQTECPGTVILPWLNAWRTHPAKTWAPIMGEVAYTVTAPVALVRYGPSRTTGIALKMKAGEIVVGRALVQGQDVLGSDVWVQRIDQIGFVHSSALSNVVVPPQP